METPTILVIDDSRVGHQIIKECTRRAWPAAEVYWYNPMELGRPGDDFDWGRFAVVMLDYQLGISGEDGLDWLRRFRLLPEMPPVIFFTGFGNEDVAVQAMKLGASDYLRKDRISPDALGKALREVLASHGHSTEELADIAPTNAGASPERTAVMARQALVGTTTVLNRPAMVGGAFKKEGEADTDRRRLAKRLAGPGKVEVPGFRVLNKLGEGGMSSIFLAERLADGERVVLKLHAIKPDEDPTELKRFMNEYGALAQVEHPHIVRIYERAFAADYAYIAMEYFPGGDLRQRLAGGLPLQKALRYFRQIGLGLQAVHERGLIHRDLKPHNVFFRTDDTLALGDFGIARSAEATFSLTATGMLVGTPQYISPEQIQGEDADFRSDLYSLGVMFFEMLTGHPPFYGTDIRAILEGHVHGAVPTLPAALAAYQPFIDGLLAKHPDDRFQSLEEVLAGLDWLESAA